MTFEIMHDKRLTSRLISYWERTRGDLDMPDISKFSKDSLDDVKDYCMVISRQPGGMQGKPMYRFDFIGKLINEVYGKDMTGEYVHSDLKNIPGATILKKADTFTKPVVAITDAGQFINDKHKIVKYRSCMVPFGRNGEITHIVAGLSWKVF